ncbi:MAG: glycosyl hydrolase [Ignavibacteria bacterium]|nr:glycosyl hydrolase [Ignavibacteria bacterium]
MKSFFTILITLIFISPVYSQEKFPEPTPAQVRLKSFQEKIKNIELSPFKNLEFINIGPTIMSGRAVDIDVSPFDPTHFYVAYASGGVWKTTNNGISFTPIFDNQIVMTIGDIAIDWKNNETIWIGTGESNSSRSSYSGFGVFKSTDGGKTFQHSGLAETHHIGRIIIHPQNPDIVYVAAMGHLYSENEERGVFKTTDGGKSWRKVLYIDQYTGCIDLEIVHSNPNILYAAMWYRTRRAWNFEEAGSTSGIYKSTDGGESWFLISTKESGFPTGDGVGRIGLSIFQKNPNVIYALLDNQFERPKSLDKKKKLTKDFLRTISNDEFLKLDKKLITDFLKENDFPKKYNYDTIIFLVKKNKITPQTLVEYIEDANAALFEKNVIGAEVYKSTDGGKSWKKTHKNFIDDFYYSYGYYFGFIKVSPHDENKIYILGVPLLVSTDGGENFKSINRENVHVDHHAIYINPVRDGHLIVANDGGINISYDDGKTYFKANTPPVGQFYSIEIDFDKPYNVYGGLQDNGVWYGPSNYKFSYAWYEMGEYPYKNLLGGDGMQIEVDKRDNKTIYAGYQFGNYFRIDRLTRKRISIKPKHELGERPLRFNWNTPILLSKHNQDILYFGANKLYRSMNKGETFDPISPDLTKGGKAGDVPYGTITTISESQLKFGLIYTGSDDGLVYLTKDGGNSWEKISDQLPQNFWVSRVVASNYDTATVYVALNGYRWDNFEPLLFKSTNYGRTWTKIGLNLPLEPINVVAEDPINPNLIYVGTDHGVYASLDGGINFYHISKNFPFAPVHDLIVHPRDSELLIATHGRSIYKTNVKQIQLLTNEILEKDIHIFGFDKIIYNQNWGDKTYTWGDYLTPEVVIPIYSKHDKAVEFTVKSQKGLSIYSEKKFLDRGMNFIKYDLKTDSTSLNKLKKEFSEKISEEFFERKQDGFYYLVPGKYVVEIFDGKERFVAYLEIEQTKQSE